MFCQHVDELIRRQKNDANDALVIYQAALPPHIYFVAVRAVEQQHENMSSYRQLMAEQRTATTNQTSVLAAE